MAKTADVQQAIWGDPWFVALPPDGKLLYLWAITTDHGNLAGLFTVAQTMIQFETGLSEGRFEKALASLEGKIVFRPQTGTIWVVARAKHVRSKTKQIAASIAKAVFDCEDAEIQAAFLAKYANAKWLAEAFAERVGVEEQSGWIAPDTRAAVLERDGHKCVDCDSDDDLTIDHIRPRIFGGSSDEDNLATRCRSCNTKKGVALPSQILEPQRGSTNLGEVPSHSHSQERQSSTERPKAPDPDKLPEGLDPHLAEAARAALPVLQRVAEAKGAKPVTLLAVARAVEAYPRKNHAGVASDLEHWTLHGNGATKQAKDVVARFRNFLDGAPDQLRSTPNAPGRRTDPALERIAARPA